MYLEIYDMLYLWILWHPLFMNLWHPLFIYLELFVLGFFWVTEFLFFFLLVSLLQFSTSCRSSSLCNLSLFLFCSLSPSPFSLTPPPLPPTSLCSLSLPFFSYTLDLLNILSMELARTPRGHCALSNHRRGLPQPIPL